MSMRGTDYVESISSRDQRSSDTVEEIAGSPHNPAVFIMHLLALHLTGVAYGGGSPSGRDALPEVRWRVPGLVLD
jgi:hypothetical protein